MPETDDNVSPRDVLDFWFGPPESEEYGSPREAWFIKDDVFDEEIRSKFGTAVEAAIAGGFEDWLESFEGSLALVILLDQFPRNLFRGSPRSFAGDSKAREVASGAIERNFHETASSVQVVFYFLPFEHSEDMADQDRSMTLFNDLPASPEKENWLLYAQKHYDVIEKYGRFPHRNAVLGRENTPEEDDYLAQPDAGF